MKIHKIVDTQSERNYKDGKQEGKAAWYYDNGQIWYEGNYKDEIRDGKWTYYNEDGSIRRVAQY